MIYAADAKKGLDVVPPTRIDWKSALQGSSKNNNKGAAGMRSAFKKCTEQEEFERIFKDPVSKNIWLIITRRKHPYHPHHPQGPGVHFHQDCLRIAEKVKKYPPTTIRELRNLLRKYCADRVFSGTDHYLRSLASMLFPYITGKPELPCRSTDPR